MEFAVVIDCGMSAEKKAADMGEDGGATRGDAVLGDEFKEIGEGEIYALRGLEVLRGFEKEEGVIFLGGLCELGVLRAKRRIPRCGEAALFEVSKAVLTARRRIGGVGYGIWVGAHERPRKVELGVPTGAIQMVVKRKELRERQKGSL